MSRTSVRSGDPASGTVVAATDWEYNNASTYGNRTVERRWDDQKGALTTPLTDANSVVTRWSYDEANHGNPVQTTSPNGNVTTIRYDDKNLYPVSRSVAGLRSFSTVYDFDTGLLRSETDNDNSVTTTYSYDQIGRPTLTKQGAGLGAAVERWTQTSYNDAQLWVKTKRDLNQAGDGLRVDVVHYDPAGRARLTRATG